MVSITVLLGNFLFEGSVLGFAGFELWKLNRERRRDRAKAEASEEAARHAERQEPADEGGAQTS
jgi:hypothetical protein